jgi:hypothetical protein
MSVPDISNTMIISSYPTNSFHALNIIRLIRCVPADATILSVSTNLYEKVQTVINRLEDKKNIRIVRDDNRRYDTGKWCLGIMTLRKEFKNLRHLKWILLANDSIFMLRRVPELYDALASNMFDIGGITSSNGWPLKNEDRDFHVQSYLRVFTPDAIELWTNYSCGLPIRHTQVR